MLGLLEAGLSAVATGNVACGIALQDEAAAAALAGDLDLEVTALVFRSVAWDCCRRADYARAHEWFEEWIRWSQRYRGEAPPICALVQAEILLGRGDLSAAYRLAVSCECEVQQLGPWASGERLRVLGLIRLAQGDLSGAEHALMEASELRGQLEPELSVIALSSGRPALALRLAERALASSAPTDPIHAARSRLALVRAALAVGRPELAEAGADALSTSCEGERPAAVDIIACEARAHLTHATGRPDDATSMLVNAASSWGRLGAAVFRARIEAESNFEVCPRCR